MPGKAHRKERKPRSKAHRKEKKPHSKDVERDERASADASVEASADASLEAIAPVVSRSSSTYEPNDRPSWQNRWIAGCVVSVSLVCMTVILLAHFTMRSGPVHQMAPTNQILVQCRSPVLGYKSHTSLVVIHDLSRLAEKLSSRYTAHLKLDILLNNPLTTNVSLAIVFGEVATNLTFVFTMRTCTSYQETLLKIDKSFASVEEFRQKYRNLTMEEVDKYHCSYTNFHIDSAPTLESVRSLLVKVDLDFTLKTLTLHHCSDPYRPQMCLLAYKKRVKIDDPIDYANLKTILHALFDKDPPPRDYWLMDYTRLGSQCVLEKLY